MSASVSIRDAITPALRRHLDKLKNPGPILRAMAGIVVSLSEQSWNNAALRPTPWVPKVDGSEATLKGNPPILARSLLAQPPADNRIEIGSDRPYANAQNYGYAPRGLPARPFLQVVSDGGDADLTEAARTEIIALLEERFEST